MKGKLGLGGKGRI